MARWMRHASVAALALGTLVAAPAIAQETDPAIAEDANADTTGNTAPASAEILVTGSRLGQGFTAPTPITTISEQQIEDRAFGAVAELAADIPQLRMNWNIGRSSEPVGQNQPDLRALGREKTLVLLDGRRLAATSPFGGIDTNIFPVALLNGVEVVTGGASAAYGSDAVAGVVNFSLDKNFDGLKIDASYGESKYGDFKRPILSAAFGSGLMDDRLRVTVSGDFYRNTGQTRVDSRPWGRGQSVLFTNPAGCCDTLQQIVDGATFSKMTFGGLIVEPASSPLYGIQFGPGGTPQPFQFGDLVGPVFQLGGDGVNVGDLSNIGVYITRYSGFGRLSFEASDTVSLWADVLVSHVDVESDLAPNYDNGNLTIKRDNAYLPQSIRDIMDANNLSSFKFGRIQLFDDGEAENNSKTDVSRYAIGAKGSFGGWEWDAYGQISRNSFYQESVNNRVESRWFNAVDSVIDPNTGQPVCRINADANPNNNDPACQPANVFGVGSISNAALDYYRGTSFYDADMDQDVVGLNFRGEPLSTWAGPVAVAFGGEMRREKIVSVSDPISEARGWRSINQQSFSGKINVKEIYGEVLVPLLKDKPFAENLEVNAAVRYADYSSSGGVVPWKIGVNYSPVRGLRFRGVKSRDIRAANVYELFSGQNQVIRGENDPRSNGTNGIPPSYFITSLTGGNPDLDPEKADTLSFGVVYQPVFVPGLNLSIDYYKIKIKDAITTLPSGTIISNCFEQNIQSYCDFITLGSDNLIQSVQATLINANVAGTSGIDFEASYRRDIGPGTFGTRVIVNWVDKLYLGTEGGTVDYVGDLATDYAGQPEWKANLDLTYDLDRFRAGLFFRYLGGGKFRSFYVDDVNLPADQNNIDGRLYTNISAAYKITDAVELYGKIDNLFDVDPPIAPNFIVQPTIANSQMFDKIGRYYVGGIRVRF
ncbi:TonB-dependent receptor domain-containing protein [Novosphingobium aquimarinum]|uniref:TonB-dependent receptor domain-containing protein n=1 Tax=Novosphingobium aquimarinum TaxID=2682494 RepID=UPI001E450C39|nr:TonB-dependent receptor [Novosphingobium aquimarinum]